MSLLVDGDDPPRYYLKSRHRRELIAIGGERLARSVFAARTKLASRPQDQVSAAERRAAAA